MGRGPEKVDVLPVMISLKNNPWISIVKVKKKTNIVKYRK